MMDRRLTTSLIYHNITESGIARPFVLPYLMQLTACGTLYGEFAPKELSHSLIKSLNLTPSLQEIWQRETYKGYSVMSSTKSTKSTGQCTTWQLILEKENDTIIDHGGLETHQPNAVCRPCLHPDLNYPWKDIWGNWRN